MKDSYVTKRLWVAGYALDVWCAAESQLPPILLVHGIGADGTYFMPLAKELTSDYSVFVFDLPGYGKTPKPPHALSIGELADVIIAFTVQQNLQKPVLIGHSMGCQVAATAIERRPHRYSAAVLIAPTVYQKERTLVMQSYRLLQDSFKEPLSANLLLLRGYYRMGVGRFIKTARLMLCNHIEKSLHAHGVPTLMLRGEEDRIVPRQWTDFLREKVVTGQVISIPGSAHAVHYTDPTSVAKISRVFIEENK